MTNSICQLRKTFTCATEYIQLYSECLFEESNHHTHRERSKDDQWGDGWRVTRISRDSLQLLPFSKWGLLLKPGGSGFVPFRQPHYNMGKQCLHIE